MVVVPVHPDHVGPLHAIYLEATARAPHCRFAPDLTQFRNELLGLTPRLRQQVPQQSDVLVAEASGSVEGFATLTTWRDDDDGDAIKQAITGLFIANEAAADALIAACEARATDTILRAFPSTHGNTLIQNYNVGWDGLSSYVRHVTRPLSQHGYVPYTREMHLVAPLDPALLGTSSLASPLTLDGPRQQSDTYAWSQMVRAMDGETRTGICSFSDLSVVTEQVGARHAGYIWGLFVNDAYRRRGIARALLVAAMQHLTEQGCTECWLTTTADNWAAQPLYYSVGFEVVDCSVSFRKTLRA